MTGTAEFWRVDAHVHLHGTPTAALVARLAGAAAGADGEADAGSGARAPSGCRGVVWCLADMPGVRTLATLGASAFEGALRKAGATSVDARPEAMRVVSPDWTLHLIDGEQRVGSEGLEVLVVGGKLGPDAPRTTEGIVDRALERDLLPILPWGVGKWLGARGRAVSRLVARDGYRGRIALADSGTRPALWPRPAQLDAAAARGIAVLHGSDALRVANDQERTGRFGAIVPAATGDGPLADLRAHVRAAPAPVHFGRPISTWRFVRSQALLRLARP